MIRKLVNKIRNWLCKIGLHSGSFVWEEYIDVFPYHHYVFRCCRFCGKEYMLRRDRSMIGKLLCRIGWHKLIFKYRMAAAEATVVQCQRCRMAFVQLDGHPTVKLTMTEWKNRE